MLATIRSILQDVYYDATSDKKLSVQFRMPDGYLYYQQGEWKIQKGFFTDELVTLNSSIITNGLDWMISAPKFLEDEFAHVEIGENGTWYVSPRVLEKFDFGFSLLTLEEGIDWKYKIYDINNGETVIKGKGQGIENLVNALDLDFIEAVQEHGYSVEYEGEYVKDMIFESMLINSRKKEDTTFTIGEELEVNLVWSIK